MNARLAKFKELLFKEPSKTALVMLIALVGAFQLVIIATFFEFRSEWTRFLTTNGKTLYTVNEQLFEQQAPELMRTSGAETVTLWALDVSRNFKEAPVFIVNNVGRVKDLEHTPAPIFTEKIDENRQMLSLIQGNVLCADLVPTSRVGDFMAKSGITRVCRAPIISPNATMVGYITFGFSGELNPVLEESTKLTLKALSLQYVKLAS